MFVERIGQLDNYSHSFSEESQKIAVYVKLEKKILV